MWLWVHYNKILIHPIFNLLKGDYKGPGFNIWPRALRSNPHTRYGESYKLCARRGGDAREWLQIYHSEILHDGKAQHQIMLLKVHVGYCQY